jgi:alkylation response protein AidB-like acyl-CoA dehydrogenase
MHFPTGLLQETSMFFEATPEQRLLRDNIRRFMQAEVAPLISRHDQGRPFRSRS